jgi:hypothetical protein
MYERTPIYFEQTKYEKMVFISDIDIKQKNVLRCRRSDSSKSSYEMGSPGLDSLQWKDILSTPQLSGRL